MLQYPTHHLRNALLLALLEPIVLGQPIADDEDVLLGDHAVAVEVEHPEGPGRLDAMRAVFGHDTEHVQNVLERTAGVLLGGKHLEQPVPEGVVLEVKRFFFCL